MDIFEKIKTERPVVHSITNKVTMNDCANIILALKASAIMAMDASEVAEVTSVSKALCINIGTPDINSAEAMVNAGKKANELGIPVLLDPVGAGISQLRKDILKKLMNEVKISVIRGNYSEIKAVVEGTRATIDADLKDKINENNIDECVAFAKKASHITGAVVAITGETDIITDGQTAYCVHNGHEMMKYVTGAGCMTSAATSAFMAVSDDMLKAALYGVCSMGICGEIAMERMKPGYGNATYRNYIIDAAFNLTNEQFERMAKYETR